MKQDGTEWWTTCERRRTKKRGKEVSFEMKRFLNSNIPQLSRVPSSGASESAVRVLLSEKMNQQRWTLITARHNTNNTKTRQTKTNTTQTTQKQLKQKQTQHNKNTNTTQTQHSVHDSLGAPAGIISDRLRCVVSFVLSRLTTSPHASPPSS